MGIEPNLFTAYETVVRASSTSPQNLVEDLRLELRFRGNRPRVLAAGRILYGAEGENQTHVASLPKKHSVIEIHRQIWSPVPNSKRPLSDTSRTRRHLRLPG